MRLGIANSGSDTYFLPEAYLNQLKQVSINSGTERALAVAIVDSSGNQVDPVGIGTGISDGRKTVTTAGTRETLVASTTTCRKVVICAETDNTGTIVVGGSTVVASLGTRRGIPLESGDTLTIEINDLVKIYLDTTVNGDGVTFYYLT